MFNKDRDPAEPMRLRFKDYVVGFLYMFAVVFALTLTAFGVWLGVCLMDNKPPIDVISYKAEDAKIGGLVNVHVELYRTRACALKTSRYVTDSKGKIVFIQESGRRVNGPLSKVTLDEQHRIDPKASPGTAIMHLFCSWECPNNIIHKYLPITREYTDTFELTLAPGQPDISNETTSDEERANEEALATIRSKNRGFHKPSADQNEDNK